jgi:hypothetical protein
MTENEKASPEYKTTFNYLLTHRVIPAMFFATKELGYNFLADPELLQKFLQMAVSEAARAAQGTPHIEPPYPIEKCEMCLSGDFDTNGVIGILIPNCDKVLDCIEIAIPTVREKAAYYTCEVSENPLTTERYFTIGEWTPGGTHRNHGPIETAQIMDFLEIVKEKVYGPQESGHSRGKEPNPPEDAGPDEWA